MEDQEKREKIYRTFRMVKSILLVFALVIVTNLLGERHRSIVQDITNAEHENYIISQYHLYRLHYLFGEKRLLLGIGSSFPRGFQGNGMIEQELESYAGTKHSPTVSLHFSNLKKRYSELLELEESFLQENYGSLEPKQSKMNAILNQIMADLEGMADAEFTGRSWPSATKRESLRTNRLLLNMELTFLIVIGTIIQLVIYFPWRNYSKVQRS